MFGIADLPNGVRLRPTTAADAAAERSIHHANRKDLVGATGNEESDRLLIDMQFEARNSGHGGTHPDALFYMIEKSGEVAGRMHIDFGHNEVRIIDLTILPQWHGHGIGTTVLQAMQRIAGTLAVPVALAVLRHNVQAIKLYAQLGFRLDPETKPDSSHLLLRWFPNRGMMPSHFVGGGPSQ